MKPGYVNPGQPPFQPTIDKVSQDKNAKKRIREASKNYYKLGMPKVTHKKCSKCGRDTSASHICDTSKGKLMVATMECPKCKSTVLVDASYCNDCGKWFK